MGVVGYLLVAGVIVASAAYQNRERLETVSRPRAVCATAFASLAIYGGARLSFDAGGFGWGLTIGLVWPRITYGALRITGLLKRGELALK